MNTTLLLTLDKRKPKTDLTCPIVLRLIHFRRSADIRTGVYITPPDWDEDLRKIRTSYKGTESVTRLNNLLQKKKAAATDIITKLDEQKTLDGMTAYEIRDLIERKGNKMSFFEYGDTLVESLKTAKRIGTAESYKGTLSALRTYWNNKPLSFQQLNVSFLQNLEIAHLQKGKKYNGLAFYLRTIRAIYNKAIKEGLVDKELYPFASYSIKTEKTRKRALKYETLQKIIALPLQPGDPLFHARSYFLLSYMFRGMPFTDLMHLQPQDIIDGRIIYDRQKTGTPYNIKISDDAQTILNHYLSGKEKEEYVFPTIKRISLEDQYKDVRSSIIRYNRKLKKLAKLCGIEENLTSYVSRHSFATRAKNLGIPIAAISDMMGHDSISTTQIYLDSLPSDLMDDYHAQVIK